MIDRNQPNKHQGNVQTDVNFTKNQGFLRTHGGVFHIFFPCKLVLPGMSTDDGSHGQRRAYQLGGRKKGIRLHQEAAGRVCCEHGIYFVEDDVWYVGTVYVYIHILWCRCRRYVFHARFLRYCITVFYQWICIAISISINMMYEIWWLKFDFDQWYRILVMHDIRHLTTYIKWHRASWMLRGTKPWKETSWNDYIRSKHNIIRHWMGIFTISTCTGYRSSRFKMSMKSVKVTTIKNHEAIWKG